MDANNCLVVEEVSKKIGLTEKRVREPINLKEIKATKIDRWWIRPEDLELFMKAKEQESSDICPISTMKDMYDIVKESDNVATF